MSPVNVSAPKLAEFALAAIAQASIPMDDVSLAMAQATRQFLRMIQGGALVVNPPAPPPAPINGSEGVVPASVSGAPQS